MYLLTLVNLINLINLINKEIKTMNYNFKIPSYTANDGETKGYMLEDCKEFLRQVCELNAFKFSSKKQFMEVTKRWLRKKEFKFQTRNGKWCDMFEHHKHNLYFVNDILSLYYDHYSGNGKGKFYLDAIYRPNPEKFILAVRDAMSNTCSETVDATVYKLHKWINGIRYVCGAKGGKEYKKMLVLHSDLVGGTGKTFFVTGLIDFLNSLSIKAALTTIGERFNNFDTATNMVCVLDEFKYPRSEDSELGFLNRVIDKTPTEYEKKGRDRVLLTPKAQLIATTTEKPKHTNSRRYDIITYNYNPVLRRDRVREELEGLIPHDEAHLRDIILRLFAYCPSADFEFPISNIYNDHTNKYDGIHASFLFEIQESMRFDGIYAKTTVMDFAKHLYFNNSNISSSYLFPLFKNKVNQLVTDLYAKGFLKHIVKRGCAAHHYIFNLNDLLSIPVGMEADEADIEDINPAVKTYRNFRNYMNTVHEAVKSNIDNDFGELKDIYNKILSGELNPYAPKRKLTAGRFNKDKKVSKMELWLQQDRCAEIVEKTLKEEEDDNIGVDNLLKDDNLISNLEKEDEPLVSLDELIDEIELEETDVKLTENDIRNVLLMPECATLTTPPVFHHADNNQFWVSAKPTNKCLVNYVKALKAGENPILDRKAENLIPTAFVYESDGLDLSSQKRIVKKLLESEFKENVLSITYSGNKSIHILIKIRNDQGGAIKDIFKEIWYQAGEHIFGEDIKYMDKACASVGRLTRLPGAINLTTGKKQICYYLNPRAKGLWMNPDGIEDLKATIKNKKNNDNAIEKKENKTYNNDIDEQFRAICNKSKNSSAQIALDILESGHAPQGNDLIFAVKYVANLIKYNSKFHSIGQRLVDICHEQHPSNIVYKTIDEYIE